MKKLSLFLFTLLMPLLAFAEGVTFPDPLNGATVEPLFKKLFGYALWAGAVLVTILVVVAAFILMMSKGDPAEIKKAKNTLIYAVVGFIVLLFSKTIQVIILSLFR